MIVDCGGWARFIGLVECVVQGLVQSLVSNLARFNPKIFLPGHNHLYDRENQKATNDLDLLQDK